MTDFHINPLLNTSMLTKKKNTKNVCNDWTCRISLPTSVFIHINVLYLHYISIANGKREYHGSHTYLKSPRQICVWQQFSCTREVQAADEEMLYAEGMNGDSHKKKRDAERVREPQEMQVTLDSWALPEDKLQAVNHKWQGLIQVC